MISPLLPFTGGLRGQAAEIVSILAYHAPAPFGLFCDPFFGGGSVSYEAKRRGFSVWSNDLAKRSYFPASALIVNAKPIAPEVVERLIQPHPLEDDFTREPRLLATIEGYVLRVSRRVWLNAITDTERYLAMRVFIALVPQGAFGLIKKTDTSPSAIEVLDRSRAALADPQALVDKFRRVINAGLFFNGHEQQASIDDAVAHIAKCGDAGSSVAHIDPPTYGTKQYDNRYWWLDWFVGDKIDEQGRGFAKADAIAFSRACVQAAKDIPVVAITQQEVAYDKKVAFELLEEAGRKTSGYLLKSNTSNPFFIIVGVL
jgi:hypothetical protein